MPGHRKGFELMIKLAPISLLIGITVNARSQQKTNTDTPPAAAPASAIVQVQVDGEVAHPLKLSADELAKLPRQTVKAKAHDGTESQYEGVPVVEILTKAGVPLGKDLRGKAMALYLVVEASDDYRAVFALAELDPGYSDRVILLADHRDGRSLTQREGPLQIVVPGEKRYARWVRQVIRLRVGRA
jgi:DMSO/TMAO reductase YedYZ molybdopterin-dependent catalytic subunit